ncbi:hypothetical protein BC831DRAFT_300658 [Entophlyctis helioformis]|nr:hypothetical protein BC831DRAFT_300658 [Entophlyctis helioformis]
MDLLAQQLLKHQTVPAPTLQRAAELLRLATSRSLQRSIAAKCRQAGPDALAVICLDLACSETHIPFTTVALAAGRIGTTPASYASLLALITTRLAPAASASASASPSVRTSDLPTLPPTSPMPTRASALRSTDTALSARPLAQSRQPPVQLRQLAVQFGCMKLLPLIARLVDAFQAAWNADPNRSKTEHMDWGSNQVYFAAFFCLCDATRARIPRSHREAAGGLTPLVLKYSQCLQEYCADDIDLIAKSIAGQAGTSTVTPRRKRQLENQPEGGNPQAAGLQPSQDGHHSPLSQSSVPSKKSRALPDIAAAPVPLPAESPVSAVLKAVGASSHAASPFVHVHGPATMDGRQAVRKAVQRPTGINILAKTADTRFAANSKDYEVWRDRVLASLPAVG